MKPELAKRKRGLRAFWQRVTEGITLHALWSQFVSEARAGYDFYTRDVDWEVLRTQSRVRRFARICRVLFWAMMMKLSPARRVVLLVALVCGVLALTSARVETGPGKFVIALPENGEMVLISLGGLLILLALELSDRVTMKRDLEIAREIQQWLLPDAPPHVAGLDIAFTSRPANTVGGDFYDAFLRDSGGSGDSGRLLVVVADVAGKSVPAALLMATFQAKLTTLNIAHNYLPPYNHLYGSPEFAQTLGGGAECAASGRLQFSGCRFSGPLPGGSAAGARVVAPGGCKPVWSGPGYD